MGLGVLSAAHYTSILGYQKAWTMDVIVWLFLDSAAPSGCITLPGCTQYHWVLRGVGVGVGLLESELASSQQSPPLLTNILPLPQDFLILSCF